MRLALLTLLIVALALTGCAGGSHRGSNAGAAGQELVVFAAASLTDALGEAGAAFEARHPGVKIIFNFAGSQQLAAQLEEGATAGVFASASQKEMAALTASGLIDPAAVRPFARNTLVVALPAANPARIGALADLARPGVKLVLADESVPAGAYTLRMLDDMAKDAAYGPAYREAVLANVVSREQNVRAVLNKVALGEGDAGIVYRTDVAARGSQVTPLAIPPGFNPPATYPIAPLGAASEEAWPQAFIDFVTGTEGQAVLSKYGFLSVQP